MGKRAAADTVACFSELHDRLSHFGERWIFRGHAHARWSLIPRVGRPPYQGNEGPLFTSWKRRAVEHLTSHLVSDWDWLAIAQHHGLATRLLDWTTNPLIAAYFSVKESPEGPAVIHAARFRVGFDKSAELLFSEPFASESIAIFRPR